MNNSIQELNRIIVLLGNFATVFMVVPIVVAVINYKNLNKPLKILFGFSCIRLFISLLTQFIIWLVSTYVDYFLPILKKLDIHNMSFISILAHLSNFAILGWYFILIIHIKRLKVSICITSFVLFFLAILNYFFVEGYKNPNVFNSISSNIFCFFMPLLHLWFLYRQDYKVPIFKNPYFWVSIGLVIPNLTGLITSIIGKKLEQTDLMLFYKVNIVYGVLQIIGYLFIAVAFYYAYYTKYLYKTPPQ